jgi:hypothetical protein
VSRVEVPEPRRQHAVVLVAFGGFALAVGIALGPQTAAAGAAALVGACLLALREMDTPTITWPNALAAFVLFMWLMPAKGYRLPVTLPFQLEPYRLVLVVLVLALVVSLASHSASLDFGGRGIPIALMAGAGIAAAFLNYDVLGSEAFKALSYFLGFFAVFALVLSTIRTQQDVDTILRAFVVGAAVVGLLAAYESRTGYNIFNHLHEYIPGLVREVRTVSDIRGGNVRVFGSAQHPIALAGALVLAFPFSLYLSRKASSLTRSRLWLAAGGACAIGAAATIARTSVVMVLAMLVVALWLRAKQMLRFWPLILVFPVVIKFAVPGALGGIWNAFFPEQGLLEADLYSRPGEGGSGRFADIGPGLTLWSYAPILGHGLGNSLTTANAQAAQAAVGAEGAIIYFDNQYMSTLVSVGLVGLVATVWFVWGSFVDLARSARRDLSDSGDLMAMFAVAIAGFGVSMALFDALAFVQVTIFFFLVVALGLRVRSLSRRP